MSIKKDVVYNFLLTGSNILFPLLTFPYLSRVIGAEGFGVTNFIFSYCQNFIIIAALGLPIYGVREIARVGNDRLKRSKLFFELLTVHVLFTIFVLIIYCTSLFLYADFSNYKQLTIFGGFFILINAFTIEWLFSGVSDFKYITIRSLIVRSLSVLAIFLFVKQKGDFNIYFIISVTTLLLSVIININYSRKYISWNPDFSLRNSLPHSKPVFLLGIYMVLNSINGQVRPTLLGFLSSKVAVGYFFAADKIIQLTISVFTAITTVMVPKLNMIIDKKGSEEYNVLIYKLLNFVICFGIPFSFLVFLLAKPLVILLGGKEFVNSIICVQIMSPIILIIALAQIFVLLILIVNRKDKEVVTVTFIGMVIGLIINVLFIPKFAELATATSQLIVEMFVTSVSFILVKKYMDFQFPVKLFIKNLVFAIPFALITYLCMKFTNNIVLELVCSAIFSGIYFLLYQFVFIRDKILLELVNPYLLKFRK